MLENKVYVLKPTNALQGESQTQAIALLSKEYKQN